MLRIFSVMQDVGQKMKVRIGSMWDKMESPRPSLSILRLVLIIPALSGLIVAPTVAFWILANLWKNVWTVSATFLVLSILTIFTIRLFIHDLRSQKEFVVENLCSTLGLFIAIAAGIIVFGCSHGRTLSDTAPLLSELQNIADCFHEAVRVVQSEPKKNETLAEFMIHCLDFDTLSESYRGGDITKLHWNKEWSQLLTSDGQVVQYRIASQEHDNMNTSSAFHTTYEFFVSAQGPTAKTTISLYIAETPE